MDIRRARPGVLLGAAAGAGALLLAGCTSGGTPAAAPTGVTASTHASGPSANGSSPAPSASGSKGTSGTSGTKGTSGSGSAPGVPALRSKPNAHGLPCNAQGLVVHLAQASGAVHGYLARPGTSGPKVLALRNRTAAATAAQAARYGAGHLQAGIASAGGCATTGALGSVARQTSTYLTTLSGLLRTGKATPGQVAAAEALMADVASQANRTGITIVDKVPTTSLLMQQS